MKKIDVVILAAGQGIRMLSALPKVMHHIAGKPMLVHLLDTLKAFNTAKVKVVISKELMNSSYIHKLKEKYGIKYFIQEEKLGTAHALSCAVSKKVESPVLVLNGDTPLITVETITKMIELFAAEQAAIVCLAFKAKNTHGYGRLITFDEDIVEIIEEKDATPAQKKIKLCNSGIYLIDNNVVKSLLSEINNENKGQEYYLPDIIRVANKKGLKCLYVKTSEEEVHGINTRAQLAKAELITQKRLRAQALANGVSMIDPKTVYLSMDTEFGKDVVIYPNVFIGEGVKIGDNVEILPFTHIVGAKIGRGSKIGPYARIRKDTVMGENTKVGNFVEIKAVEIGDNVKASHLAYLGDGKIDDNSNIGAGTIFCNFDGYVKHQTQIGKDVFVGSNVALVAPVLVGDHAIIGAGSVITENVEKNALSLARARQVNYKQKAEFIRTKKSKQKKTGSH